MHCHNESEPSDKEISLYKAGDKMEGAGTWNQADLVQIPVLHFIGPVTLGKLIKIFWLSISLSVKYLTHVDSIIC